MNMVDIILLTIMHPNAHLIEYDEKQWQTKRSTISNNSRCWRARTCLLLVSCRPRVQAAVRVANTTYKQATDKLWGVEKGLPRDKRAEKVKRARTCLRGCFCLALLDRQICNKCDG